MNMINDENEHLKRLHDALGEAVFTVKLPERTIENVNPAIEKVFGYSPRECIGKHTDILYPSQAEYLHSGEILKECMLQNREILRAEVDLRRKNGEIFPAQITSSFIKTGDEFTSVISIVQDITQQKNTEKELNEQKSRLETIIRASNTGLWDWDLRTDKVFFSSEWKNQIGYADDEISNEYFEWESRVHPEDLEQAKATIKNFTENPYPDYENEFRFRHKDGRYIWIFAKASLVRDENGVPLRMLGSHLDITRRKKAEEALREKDTMLANIASQIPGMIYRFRMAPDGTFSVPYSSEGIRDIFGCSPADVQNDFDPIFNAIHPEDREKVLQSIDESVKHMSKWRCEYRAQLPGEPIKWLLGNSIPEKRADGSIVWNGYNVDITDRKKAEEEITESEKRFKELAELLPEAVFESDLAVNLTYVNQQAHKLFGYSEKDFEEGICGIDLITPEDRERARKNIAKRLQGEDLGPVEYTAINKEGKLFPVLLHAGLFVKQGSVIGLRGVILDITKLKQAEENLNEYKDKLEEKVAERTRELQTLVNAMARRENRMVELKEVIKKLHRQLKDAGMTPVADDPLNKFL